MKTTHIPPTDFLEALISLPKLFGASVSRNGKWVAWMWMGAGAAIDIYCAPSSATTPPVRLTDTRRNSYFVSWLPASDGIILAQDQDGNERIQLFRVMLNQPNQLKPLTEPNPHYYIRGGQLHPNGRWLIYAANMNVQTGEEIEPTVVYRHDLLTGERKALARPQKAAYYFPFLNSSGTHILYNRKDSHPSGYQLWLVNIDGTVDREILNVGDDKKVYGSWLPDGKHILVRAETGLHHKLGIYNLDSETVQWLIDDPNRNIDSAYAPFGSDQIIVNEVSEARLISTLFDIDSHKEKSIRLAYGTIEPIAPSDHRHWIGKLYGAHLITDLVRFMPETLDPSSFQTITHVSNLTRITSSDLFQAEDFRWQSVDGLHIQGWLYRPRATAKGTVVVVHGGPTWHSEDALDDQIQFLVSQGFNVLDPNYRGSTGFTHTFTEAIKVDGWGRREQEDIRTGIEALIAKGIAVSGKVGITGTSYGGYSSWHAITHFPTGIICAAAPICGMTDLIVDYHTTRPDLRPYSEEMMGGTPEEVPQRYHERSPINFVSNIRGQLLVVQGMQDPNVTPENVRAVRQALDTAKIKHQLLTFDNEGHGIDRPENLKILYDALGNFFSSAFDGESHE